VAPAVKTGGLPPTVVNAGPETSSPHLGLEIWLSIHPRSTPGTQSKHGRQESRKRTKSRGGGGARPRRGRTAPDRGCPPCACAKRAALHLRPCPACARDSDRPQARARAKQSKGAGDAMLARAMQRHAGRNGEREGGGRTLPGCLSRAIQRHAGRSAVDRATALLPACLWIARERQPSHARQARIPEPNRIEWGGRGPA
jgi:hypothetical protein